MQTKLTKRYYKSTRIEIIMKRAGIVTWLSLLVCDRSKVLWFSEFEYQSLGLYNSFRLMLEMIIVYDTYSDQGRVTRSPGLTGTVLISGYVSRNTWNITIDINILVLTSKPSTKSLNVQQTQLRPHTHQTTDHTRKKLVTYSPVRVDVVLRCFHLPRKNVRHTKESLCTLKWREVFKGTSEMFTKYKNQFHEINSDFM